MTSREARIQLAFDLRDSGALRRRGEGGSRSASACPAGAANPVNEVFRYLRKIVIHDVSDPLHVDAARGDVGGHQDPIISLLESP